MTKHSGATDEHLAGLELAGRLVAERFDGWSDELREEFTTNQYNYQVGRDLLSEDDRVKVWEIRLAPGERVGVHRHVLDYFWTALTVGHSRQHTDDGTTREVGYAAGDTRHFTFDEGQYLLHDLENIGTTDLLFVTVEHKRQPGEVGPRQDGVA